MFRPAGLPILLIGLGLVAAAFAFPNRFSIVFAAAGGVAALIGIFRIVAARGVVDVPGGLAPEDLSDDTSGEQERSAA